MAWMAGPPIFKRAMTRRTRTGSRIASPALASADGTSAVHQARDEPVSRGWLFDLAGALPALAAVGVLVAWSTDQGGYFTRSWAPGAIFLLAVLLVTALADRSSFKGLPRAVQVALAALALFTAWSYLSITWADDQGVAWNGANRTLLYLVVFTLFSRSVASERSLAIALGAWTAGIASVAVLVLLELPAMLGGGPVLVVPGLGQPLGYANANAAIWLMALWPALALAACPRLAPWLRGAAAGAVVILAETSLLSESRGTLVATAVVLVILFAVVPGRVRTFWTLLAPAIAIAVTTPQTLQAANAAARDPAGIPELGNVATPVLLAALACGLVTFAAAELAARRPPSEAAARTCRRVAAATAVVLALGGAGVAVAVVGDPVDRARSAWREFRETTAPSSDSPGRLTSGFGGARYDYYRVALDVFDEHPVIGIGMDNFAQDYVARGTAGERPDAPHSLELRTLLQTGIVGALLLIVALEAALLAAYLALRRAGALGRAVAAGGGLCCLYWIVHGSVDWFWEFPALGGAAFAFLGLAGAAAPRRAPRAGADPGARRQRIARAGAPAAVALALVAAGSLALPWVADIELRRAEASWVRFPAAAHDQLDLAARLDPLSDRPGVTAGAIAIRRGDVARARRGFAQALERSPRNAYAVRWLGAIASHRGERARAGRLLGRALRLAPSDPVTLSAFNEAKAGRIDLAGLDRQEVEFVRQLRSRSTG